MDETYLTFDEIGMFLDAKKMELDFVWNNKEFCGKKKYRENE